MLCLCLSVFQIKISAYFQQLTISARDFCNMLHFSLLNLPFLPNIHLNAISARDFATCCTFLFLNSPAAPNCRQKRKKPPEQGKPASGAIIVNFILLSVPGRTSSDNGTELHGWHRIVASLLILPPADFQAAIKASLSYFQERSKVLSPGSLMFSARWCCRECGRRLLCSITPCSCLMLPGQLQDSSAGKQPGRKAFLRQVVLCGHFHQNMRSDNLISFTRSRRGWHAHGIQQLCHTDYGRTGPYLPSAWDWNRRQRNYAHVERTRFAALFRCRQAMRQRISQLVAHF